MNGNLNFDNYKINKSSIRSLRERLIESKLDLKLIIKKLKESQKVIVICGPTCSGKSKLGLILSELLDTDIISIDSIQVYRGMDIGTAKFDASKYNKKQYMIDLFEPDHSLSVVEFKEICDDIIKNKFFSVKKVPIIAGGSGLYIRSVIDGIDNIPDSDKNIRKKLKDLIDREGLAKYYQRLKKIDKEYANKISENDMRRIIRALEVYEVTGISFSSLHKIWKNKKKHYDSIFIGLDMERRALYSRIEDRVDEMFRKGLLEEVKKIIDGGYKDCRSVTQAVGYKEVLQYLKGDISIEECVSKVKMNTRRLAKKQITWFKSEPKINWIRLDNYDNIFNLIRDIFIIIKKN